MAVLGLSGCDPCSGVLSCDTDRDIRYEGEVGLKFTGEPGRGIPVVFIRSGGVQTRQDTIRTQTDSLGRFSIETVAVGGGQVTGELVVTPPGAGPNGPLSPVRVPIGLAPSRANSDVRYLGRIAVPHLYFGNFGELFYRGGPLYATEGVFARNVEVELRRTGGVPIAPDPYVVRSNGAAQFPLEPQPLEHGELVFDLVLRPPAPYRPVTLSGLRMATRFTEQAAPNLAVRAGLGPHLPYVGALFFGDSQQPAVGTEVEFRRTGGIRLAQESYRTVVNPFATFSLGPVPLEAGTVTADLIFRPPAPYATVTIRNVTLQTTEENISNVPAGRWEVPRS